MPELPPRKAHPHPAKPPLPDAKLRKPGHLRRSKARGGAPGLQMRGGASRSVTHFACKRGRTDEADAAPPPAAPPYAELQCVTNFSFQRGASHPDELVARAKELGYAALAITDEASLAGVVRAHVAAKDAKLKLLIGAEVALEDSARVVLLATDRAAYGRLCRLLTAGRRRAPKGESKLARADVLEHAEGLLAIGLADEAALRPRAGPSGLGQAALGRSWLASAFPGRAWLAAPLHDGPDDRARLARLDRISAATGLSMVATGAVDAHVPERRRLRDVLAAVRHGT